MISGIGVDLVTVSRVERVHERVSIDGAWIGDDEVSDLETAAPAWRIDWTGAVTAGEGAAPGEF